MKLTIIIDKNIFMGETLPKLCSLAKRNKVVLIPELLYECATSEECEERMLLSRATDLIRAGAYVGLQEHDIVLSEARNLEISHEIIDYERTDLIRKEGLPSENSIQSKQIYKDVIQNIKWRKEMAGSIIEYAKKKCSQILKNERQECGKISDYFAKYVDDIDNDFDITRIREWVLPATLKLTSKLDENNYCTSKHWFCWQYIRLLLVLGYVHAIRIARNNPLTDQAFERDCMDVGYVTRLSIADALISRDFNCTIPLAKAAYPKKRIYSVITDCD